MAAKLDAVTETLVENVVGLWVQRRAMVTAPHVGLGGLVRLDERLDASLEAGLARGERFARRLAEEHAQDPGLGFAAAWHAIMRGQPAALGVLAAADPDATVAALSFAAADPARRAIGALYAAPDAALRAVAVAAMGARRANPGEALDAVMADPSPLLRASACRAAGQLGRTDLRAPMIAMLRDEDPECRFQAAWAASRLGAVEPLPVLVAIARGDDPRADAALAMLLRRLPVAEANGWLADFVRAQSQRHRSLIRATGIIGDPRYIPWLLERMAEPGLARLAGEAFCLITGLDLAYLDLDGTAPEEEVPGPNDDPADEDVSLHEDSDLPFPDAQKIGAWWMRHRERFPAGTAFFLGRPKESADWLGALNDAFQRQRMAAATELAIRRPSQSMFEVRARGRVQRQLLAAAAARAPR